MKKKKQNFNENLKMPHLFREDLENIEKIIKEELKPNDYKLESESCEYQEVNEILNNENSLNQFLIQTHLPDITINFTKKNASVYADDDDIKTTGAIKKIIDVLHRRERKFLWYSSKFGQIFAFTILAFSVLSFFPVSFFNLEWEYGTIIAILSTIWIATILLVEEYKFSVIEFTHKKRRSNFFSRNKDQIGVNIIVAILSFFVGLFLKK